MTVTFTHRVLRKGDCHLGLRAAQKDLRVFQKLGGLIFILRQPTYGQLERSNWLADTRAELPVLLNASTLMRDGALPRAVPVTV